VIHQAAENRYTHMIYNRCGKSGLKLPAVSLGLWQHFGETDAYATRKAIVLRAFDLGVTHFDLANNYGVPPGSSEEIIGKIMQRELKSYRDEILITTKAGYDMWPGPYGEWGSKKYLTASLDQSLKRMQLDYVDMYYSHRPDPDTPLEETMGALDLIVRQGKALYVGISNYDLEMTREAVRILKSLGTPCLIHQPSYSIFNRWIENGLQDFLGEQGIGTIVFQPMQRGLLTDAYLNGIPRDRAVPLAEIGITETRVAKAKKLNAIAVQRGQTLAQMAVAWTLRGGRVASVLVGANQVSHVEDNVAALEHPEFSREELERIDRIVDDGPA
jgi:L-glyceraldehyde 3-phosphate reductase